MLNIIILNVYKINISNRDYSTFHIFDATTLEPVHIDEFNPFEHKLVNNDVFTYKDRKVELVHSSIRLNENIPAVLLLDGNKTYGRQDKMEKGTLGLTNAMELYTKLSKVEKELLVKLYQYPQVIAEAARDLSPGVICNYVYELAKTYSLFYHDHPILKETNSDQKAMRLQSCELTAHLIKSAFALLGIEVPEKM